MKGSAFVDGGKLVAVGIADIGREEGGAMGAIAGGTLVAAAMGEGGGVDVYKRQVWKG